MNPALWLKRTMASAGVPASALDNLRAWVYRIGAAAYRQRLSEDAELASVAGEIDRYGSLASHHAYRTHQADDVNTQHLRLQLALMIRALRRALHGRLLPSDTIIDVGDPDGVMLALSAGRGVSINILPEAAQQVKRQGGQAIQADMERLPFADGSIDYIICCETLEHLENPILGLKELARVARKGIFVSIPHVEQTTIHADNYVPGAPAPENHVFEFSRSDFEKIATHAGLRIDTHEVLEIFPRIVNPLRYLLLRTLYFPLMFPRFQFMRLVKAA